MSGSRTCLTVIFLLVLAPVAHAGWSTVPATIKPTTANIPLVKACSDGGDGSFVAWQEESSPGTGILRGQHLVGSGDLDPTWPADGAVVCSATSAPKGLGVLPDHQGGFYAWWEEGDSLHLKRMDRGGHTAPGWPARGRLVASMRATKVIEDGAGGIYLAVANGLSVAALHVGPDNAGAGGWPDKLRTLAGSDDAAPYSIWPNITLAPDGGLFAAYASFGMDSAYTPGSWRVRRLTSAGQPAAGWPAGGISLGAFDRGLFTGSVDCSLLGLDNDGTGGVYVLIGNPVSGGEWPGVRNLIFRVAGDGSMSPDWPDSGVHIIDAGPYYPWGGHNRPYSLVADVPGLVYAGMQTDGCVGCSSGIECEYGFTAWVASGQAWGGMLGTGWSGFDVAPIPGGGLYSASFFNGQAGMECHTGSFGLSELSRFGNKNWYLDAGPWLEFGGVGLAVSEDCGVVCCYSLIYPERGLFAQRFNTKTEVTAVPPALVPTSPLTGVHFEPALGARATVTLATGRSARLDLFDVSGRRLATLAVAGLGAPRRITLPGTRALASGIYFLRLAGTATPATARVVVTR